MLNLVVLLESNLKIYMENEEVKVEGEVTPEVVTPEMTPEEKVEAPLEEVSAEVAGTEEEVPAEEVATV